MASAAAEPLGPDAGWTLAVAGSLPGEDAAATHRAVAAAIPAPLLDPAVSFVARRPPAAADAWRIVVAVNAPDGLDPVDLCSLSGRDGEGGTGAARGSTAVDAALCDGETVRASAREIRQGALRAGDLTFRFMVRDAVQQLFPLGYDHPPPRDMTRTR
jgi:hypothetical protein